MSKGKRSKIKPTQAPENNVKCQAETKKLTPEEAAAIVKNRLANRPVIVWRYPNGKYNKRFIVTLVIMVIALIVALYFFSRTY